MYLNANLLVYILLLFLDLLLELLDLGTVWCCAIGLEDLDISGEVLAAIWADGARVEGV